MSSFSRKSSVPDWLTWCCIVLLCCTCASSARLLQHDQDLSMLPEGVPISQLHTLREEHNVRVPMNARFMQETERQERSGYRHESQKMVPQKFKNYEEHQTDHRRSSEHEEFMFHVDYSGPKRHPPQSH